MPVNRATLSLIQKHEGLRLEAYPDPGYGWKIASIGFGHTTQAGPPVVTKGMRITEAEALRILEDDLLGVEVQVREAVTVPLTDNQLGALVSLVFNIGGGAFRRSTLLKKLNKADYAGAAAEFARWTKSNGKVLPGLVKRRADEAALFETPVKPSRRAETEIGQTKTEIGQPPAASVDTPNPGFWARLFALVLPLIKKVIRK